MTDSQKDYLVSYIRLVGDMMKLKEHTLVLLNQTSDEGTAAQVRCIEGRNIVELRVSERFHKYSREEQRHYIVHELLHIHFDNACTVIELDLSRNPSIAISESKFIFSAFMRQMEYGIDNVAYIIEQSIPLPNEDLKPNVDITLQQEIM